MKTTKKLASSEENISTLLDKLDFRLRKAFKDIIQEAEPLSLGFH